MIARGALAALLLRDELGRVQVEVLVPPAHLLPLLRVLVCRRPPPFTVVRGYYSPVYSSK